MLNKVTLLVAAFFIFVADTSIAADRKTEVPPDTPEFFLQRYERFIDKKERKLIEEINKRLKAIEKSKNKNPEPEKTVLVSRRDQLIAKFWADHDTDPSTPENEFKDKIDARIDNIEQEIFFTSQETPGLLFRNNDGIHGDMAWVYLLHGSPDDEENLGFRSLMPANGVFTDMMLWIYMDQNNNSIRFAFLFYRKNGGPYRIFPQESYGMDPCGAVNEVLNQRSFASMGCTAEVENAIRQLEMQVANDGTSGYTYLLALWNFSSDPDIKLGKALQPPPSVSEISKQSVSKVVGEPALLSKEEKASYILSAYNSMIPVEFSGGDFTVNIARKNLDWVVRESGLTSKLKDRVIVESLDNPKIKPVIVEGESVLFSSLDSFENEPEFRYKIDLFLSGELESLPPGHYRLSIYIKNVITDNSGKNVSNKYAALLEKFVKKQIH